MHRGWRKTTLVILLIPLFVLLMTSCQQEGENRIDDVLHIRHKGADMPAYVHGIAEKNVFLVVLHGAGSFGLAFRDGAFTETLEEEYVIVYWDQRGQGMSQGRYDPPEDLIGLMAEDVHALVQVLRSKYGADIKLFLMGHSWGGLLGASALLDDPAKQARFNGWICVDGALDLVRAAEARRGLMLAIAEEQISAGNNASDWEVLREEVSELDSLSDEDYNPMLRYALHTMQLLQVSNVVPATISSEKLFRTVIDNNPITWQVSNLFNQPVNAAIEQEYTVSGRLNEIIIPTLMMFGKYDVSVPPLVGREAYKLLGSSNKSLVIFDQSIHHPHDTEPGKFSDTLISFIEKHR